jgi:hypothetical protein
MSGQNAKAADTPKPKLLLFEHDDRFKVFSEYHFYDFLSIAHSGKRERERE